MAEFLSVDTTTASTFKRTVAGGSLAGDLFKLPAGMVATAFGVEYRRDSFTIRPDEVALSNDLAAVQVPPIRNAGSFNLFEVFGEVRVPILADKPFFKMLALEGAARYADYNTIGGVFTWRGAVDWQLQPRHPRAEPCRTLRAHRPGLHRRPRSLPGRQPAQRCPKDPLRGPGRAGGVHRHADRGRQPGLRHRKRRQPQPAGRKG
jgi:hypothetical protein